MTDDLNRPVDQLIEWAKEAWQWRAPHINDASTPDRRRAIERRYERLSEILAALSNGAK